MKNGCVLIFTHYSVVAITCYAIETSNNIDINIATTYCIQGVYAKDTQNTVFELHKHFQQ